MRAIRNTLVALMLVGLAACNASVSGNVYCSGGSSSSTNCAGMGNLTLTNRPGDDSNSLQGVDLSMLVNGGAFDAAKVAWDFSNSTTPILSNSGYVNVEVTLANTATSSTSFAWTRVGQTLVPQNPSAVNAWLANLKSPVASVDFSLPTIGVDNYAGTNVITGEIKYDTVVQAGAAYAWYNDCSGYCVIR